jgi:hypothetical protein
MRVTTAETSTARSLGPAATAIAPVSSKSGLLRKARHFLDVSVRSVLMHADASHDALESMDKGELNNTVFQDPVGQGEEGVNAAYL